ncbi:hypothetical protein N9529_05485 [Crocinitomicaceae bacterium]|nr:hypothetical protein [Crocinitomicaceae bacterium]MDC0100244.1 hypothetical protein [Crocinitomicaceae bacterium]
MRSIYNSYYSQIEPYVTGEFDEQSRYTFLNSDNGFSSVLNRFISHTSSRCSVVDAYAP